MREKLLQNKKAIIIISLIIIVILGIFGIQSCNHQHNETNKPNETETIKLSDSVKGIKQTYEVDLNDKDFNFLNDVKYDDKSLSVEVDTTKVKFDTVGLYDIEFIIKPLTDDEQTETIKSKVNIVDNNKKDETSKPEETDKTETSVETEKPQVNENDNVVSKPTTNQNTTKPTTPTKPTEPTKPVTPTKPQEHKHTWVDVTTTVHHDAVTEQKWVVDNPAWDEPIYEKNYFVTCNLCGARFNDDPSTFEQDLKNHVLFHDAPIGYTEKFEKIQVGTKHHDEIGHYETVVTQPAWDETIVTGQKCSGCGASK